jgi:hypothetical protein
MADNKDYLGETLRLVERAREDTVRYCLYSAPLPSLYGLWCACSLPPT